MWGWENSHKTPAPSALELLRVVFSPHCSSPSTPTTAPLRPLCQTPEVCRTDTTLVGPHQDGDESAYRQEVKELAVWCSLNNLELNTLKTVEMIVDFRRNPPALPPTHYHDSSWKRPSRECTFFVTEKVKPATGAHDTVLLCCYWVGSVLFYNCMVWVSQQIRYKKTQRTVRTAERIIGVHLPSLQDLYYSRVKKRAGNIITDPLSPWTRPVCASPFRQTLQISVH